MSRVILNKTALKKERDQLDIYRQYLPSLDMKRKQFLFELKKERRSLEEVEEEIAALRNEAAEWLPLLAEHRFDLHGLVRVGRVELGEQNVLGVNLPRLDAVEIEKGGYSMLAKPTWVDSLVEALAALARLELRHRVAARRVRLLEEALRTLTQRVNLFEKVLIPDARQRIRRIGIFLADTERAAVIRSKMAKAKLHGEKS